MTYEIRSLADIKDSMAEFGIAECQIILELINEHFTRCLELFESQNKQLIEIQNEQLIENLNKQLIENLNKQLNSILEQNNARDREEDLQEIRDGSFLENNHKEEV